MYKWSPATPVAPPPWAFAIESNSSKKMTQGARALSKTSRTFASNQPNRRSAGLKEFSRFVAAITDKKKNAPISFATASAMSILPVSGGLNRRIPRGGLIPIDLKSCE